jgi:ubiquinone/menaquinone biosynthesis C-methylase UbiE
MPSPSDRRDSVQGRFNELGPRWTAMYDPGTPIGHGLAVRLECCVELLGDMSGKRLLDLGCGTGSLIPFVGSTVLEYEGIDAAPAMVDVARTRIRKFDLGSRFHVREGDVQALPFPSASFDAVVALGLLGHLDDPRRAIREAVRVARPDALLIFSTARRTSPDRRMVGATSAARAVVRRLSGRQAALPEVVAWTDAATRQLLESAGCTIVAERFFDKRILPYPVSRLFPRLASRTAALVEDRSRFNSFAVGYMTACAPKMSSAGIEAIEAIDSPPSA